MILTFRSVKSKFLPPYLFAEIVCYSMFSMNHFFYKIFAACLAFFAVLEPLAVSAQATSTAPALSTFNPGYILDDADMFGLGIMTRDSIRDFLASKGSGLAHIKLTDIDGEEKWPTDIVWRVATSYRINPKYLLALMQKEQSLVEDPSPSQKQLDWATGFAVCDSCSMNDPALQQYKGFASQLEWAAKQHTEKYLLQLLGRGTTISGIAPGKAVKIDGQTVIPANKATAMLYTYTPHLHGNLNLWNIWQRWFGLNYPDGTFVMGKTSKTVYLIRFDQKRPLKSKAVAASMIDPNKILLANDSTLAGYPTGDPIAFANYSLVQAPDKKRYLLVGSKKRLIVSRQVFSKIGFNEDEVVSATEDDLKNYDDGPDITAATSNPTGLLAKDSLGNYWYVEDGIRQFIPDKLLLKVYFRGRPAKLLSQKTLATLTIGTPYQVHEGELVRTPDESAVFVIENGKKRPIPSGAVFEEVGWKWKNVLVLPTKLLNDYPMGDPVLSHPNVTLADTSDQTNN